MPDRTDGLETERSRQSIEVDTAPSPNSVPRGPQAVPSSINYSGAHSDEILIERWLHGKSPATGEVYRSAWAAFSAFTSYKPLASMTLADLQEFSDEIEEAFAPSTRAKILAAIKSLISFGHQTGYLAFDVGKALSLPKRRDELAERILTPDEVHSMIATAGEPGDRDRTLLRALYRGFAGGRGG